MDNIKNDAYYVQKIILDMCFIDHHMTNTSRQQFDQNEVLQDSMMFRLIQISENAKKLTEEYKQQHNEIPWTDIYGLRNRIVHEYGNVDLSIIFDTLTLDIPWVLHQLQEIH